MVRRCVLGVVTAACVGLAGPAAAQADWRQAGGPLFAEVAAEPALRPAETSDDATIRLPPSRQPFEAGVADAAARRRIDPKLLHALVVVESGYRSTAASPAGAVGLTQLMPRTAQALGVSDALDTSANLSAGAEYLARQLLRFGDLRLALAAYNAGPERVARLGRVPEIPETRAYVAAVIDCYLALAAGRTVRSRQDCRSPAP